MHTACPARAYSRGLAEPRNAARKAPVNQLPAVHGIQQLKAKRAWYCKSVRKCTTRYICKMHGAPRLFCAVSEWRMSKMNHMSGCAARPLRTNHDCIVAAQISVADAPDALPLECLSCSWTDGHASAGLKVVSVHSMLPGQSRLQVE